MLVLIVKECQTTLDWSERSQTPKGYHFRQNKMAVMVKMKVMLSLRLHISLWRAVSFKYFRVSGEQVAIYNCIIAKCV